MNLLNLFKPKPWSNMRIIIGQSPDFKTDKTNLIEDFYYHPKEPNDWIHTLQEERLFPKDYGRICLNEERAFDTVYSAIARINTDKIISISCQDNSEWCDCYKCRTELSSGTLIQFVNRIASRFPNKKFSTLAYYRTEEPPKIRPLPNVQVIITTIQIPKDEPYETSRREDVVEWRRRLNGWLKLTKNVAVWDYYSNFRHLLMPYPILYSIAPNIRYFAKLGIRDFIIQTNAGTGHEFSELKSHLISELMWNPFADGNKVINDFGRKYYGNAWPYVKEYIDLLHEKQKGGYHLINWADPKEFVYSFLNSNAILEYQSLLREAEWGVGENTELELRVNTLWLQLEYIQIEMDLYSKDVDSFKETCSKLGNVTVNEENLSWQDYLKQKGL